MSMIQRSPAKSNLHLSNPELASSAEQPNVALRKRKHPDGDLFDAFNSFSAEIRNTLSDWRQDLSSNISNISANITSIRNDLDILTATTSEIKSEINDLRSNQTKLEKRVLTLESSQSAVNNNLTELQTSTQFLASQYDDYTKKVAKLETGHINADKTSDAIVLLESKIDSLEQQARQCNLELGNVPEKRGENLLRLIESLGSLINVQIAQSDVVSVHRVPHAQPDSRRPKNIIVKVSSRILRDNILSAFRLRKGVTANELGLSNHEKDKIYCNEHLTLSSKKLFRECREKTKQYEYKYVWVKHATILVRESDNSPVIAIRSHKDLCKIKPRNK
ncbi:unnamed protein product [Plutella xylostella]|uniref:(diamondback moth) hypothetical protein n=1 Tax=Plutella xylostella TaxID=51655 RepID=A0A8S4E3Q2_PLUXY|nr:unnamed protein product [Plutella xylostella]CAG9122651.1 unnamed protein product [Plutella xylostella]